MMYQEQTAIFTAMTKRDWFAGHALTYLGQRKDITIRDANHIAVIAYEIADAMIAESKRKS